MKDKLAILKWYDTRDLPQIDYDNIDKDFAKAICEGAALKKEVQYVKASSDPKHEFLVRFDDNGNFFGFTNNPSNLGGYSYNCVGKKLKDGGMAVLIFNRLSYNPDARGVSDIFGSLKDIEDRSFIRRFLDRRKKEVTRQFHIIVTDESGLQIYGTKDSWVWQRCYGNPTYLEFGLINGEFGRYRQCKSNYALCSDACRDYNPECKGCARKCKERTCHRDLDCAKCGDAWAKCKCPEHCSQFISRSDFEAKELERISVLIVEHFDDLLKEQKVLVRRAPLLIEDELAKIKS